ncbi:MAG: SDR family NAD(P)-dependent oxidoreductase [Bacteroidetes bacterium]|nr:SDR family NAD(P)-dependent oxidoreductase [Bacteroidota bacterium]
MNKKVLITGASSGIGRATAILFAEKGFDLILNGRRKDLLEELKNKIIALYPVAVITSVFDVRDQNSVFESISSLKDEWKQVDILINNAGLAAGRDLIDEGNIEDWENMMNTNVNGLLYVTKAILPEMIRKKSGHIINIGSIAGDDMYERGNIYCASKAAVDAISRSMRIDLLPHHIKVTNIKPGAAETEFAKVRFKGDEAKAAQTYAGFEPLTANDIADAIIYCATTPPNVCINELSLTCLAQANGNYLLKEKS